MNHNARLDHAVAEKWLNEWRNDPTLGYFKKRGSAMARLVKILPVPLEQLTAEILEDCTAKITPSFGFRVSLMSATRHFVAYCHEKGWIESMPRIRRSGLGTYRNTPLPEGLRQQITGVFAKHRNRKTGDSLRVKTIKHNIQTFEAFYSIVAKVDSSRRLETLEDFVARDLDIYQQAIEEGGSLSKDKAMSPRTVQSLMMHVISVFAAAKKVLGWKINPMDEYEVPRYQHVQRDVYLTKDEVSTLIATAPLEGLTLKQEFLEVRLTAMAAVQYSAALRPQEVVRLLDSELLWNRESKGGMLPFIIRGAKARPDGHEELFYFAPPAVAAIRRYLDIRERYCAKLGLVIRPVKDLKTQKVLGSPLFITRDARTMGALNYEALFMGLVRRTGMDPNRITCYALRHSRISHWVEDGIPIDRVSRFARHRDVNFTIKHYVHYQPDADRHLLDTKYGIVPKAEPILTRDILPDRPVLRQILKAAAELLGAPVEAGKVDQLEQALAEKVSGRQGREELTYSIVEALEMLDLGRTQIYDWMRKGYLHPVTLPNGRKGLPKAEIDLLAALRTSKEASLILGYREKVPTTIQRMVREGTLKATKVGNENLYSDRDLVDCLLWKNGHKRAFGVRPHQPRGCNLQPPAAVISSESQGG